MKKLLLKVLLWSIFVIALFAPTVVRMRELRQKDDALSRDMARLKAENRRLSEEIDMLQNDPVYIEEIAREKLKVARKNETIVRFINNEE